MAGGWGDWLSVAVSAPIVWFRLCIWSWVACIVWWSPTVWRSNASRRAAVFGSTAAGRPDASGSGEVLLSIGGGSLVVLAGA